MNERFAFDWIYLTFFQLADSTLIRKLDVVRAEDNMLYCWGKNVIYTTD